MDFLELAKTRYSVRSFKKDHIEQEKLDKIIEAGRVAPTACNNQPQKVFIARSKESREKLASVCKYTFDAPIILVVCYDKDKSWKNHLMPGYQSGETDAAIVCTHMMLEAFELGIGSCWVGWFNEEEIRRTLNLPSNIVVSALLPIGYPSDDNKPSNRHVEFRDIKETVEEI